MFLYPWLAATGPLTDLDTVTSLATRLTVTGVLIAIIFGGINHRWWVFAWQYGEMKRERDEWKEIALRSTNLAETLNQLRPPMYGEGGKK